MGMVKRAGDLLYTFRFLKLLTTNFQDTAAFRMGLIDARGKKRRRAKNPQEKNAYTPFHRLVYNIKRLIPGGKVGSYASALYLIKEQFSLSDRTIKEALKEFDIDPSMFLAETSSWFILEDGRLAYGDYKLKHPKVVNGIMEDVAGKHDWVRASNDCYPVGAIFGMDIYEVTHKRSGQSLYVSIGDLLS